MVMVRRACVCGGRASVDSILEIESFFPEEYQRTEGEGGQRLSLFLSADKSCISDHSKPPWLWSDCERVVCVASQRGFAS